MKHSDAPPMNLSVTMESVCETLSDVMAMKTVQIKVMRRDPDVVSTTMVYYYYFEH